MDNSISFSKIVATPTLNSWSQAYNAGKLFAVLSLEKTPLRQGSEGQAEKSPEIESLNMLGRDLLERLEQEFFTIEDKNLESIKKAVSATFENMPESVTISFAAGALVGNILYLFGLGNSKIFIKRGGNFGLLLDSEKAASESIASSSGFLEHNDLIVLATEAFSEVIAENDLSSNLSGGNPAEIAEFLAPKIHKAENGKISAIIIKYQKPQADPSDTQDELGESLRAGEVVDEGIEVAEEIKQEQQAQERISLFNKYLSLLKSKLKLNFKTRPTKKLFLAAAIIIAGILIFSVFTAIRGQNNAKVRQLFAEIYPQAQKKYDEGQSLVDLNKTYARDSFLSAQKILNENKDKFPAKSKELAQTQDLLNKVQDGLAQVSPIDKSGLDRSKLSVTVTNGSGIEGTAGKAAEILKEVGYNVVSTGNADNYNYQGVMIKVKKEKSKFLDLLKKDLSKDYTISSAASDLPSTSPSDTLIIIGK